MDVLVLNSFSSEADFRLQLQISMTDELLYASSVQLIFCHSRRKHDRKPNVICITYVVKHFVFQKYIHLAKSENSLTFYLHLQS